MPAYNHIYSCQSITDKDNAKGHLETWYQRTETALLLAADDSDFTRGRMNVRGRIK
jgi:Cft2 family RNA processing exonuclease